MGTWPRTRDPSGMETSTQNITTTGAATLPANLRLGPVHLTVTNLDRSIPFYSTAVGLNLIDRTDGVATMGTGDEPVLYLHELGGARPAGRHAGLYHVALLYPTREELAHAAARLAVTRTPIQGASDHGTHEAIYLPDPDGNGLELAADRPRDEWPELTIYNLGPAPLDIDDLLAAAGNGHPNASAAPGLKVGHLHLHVGDVEEGLRFYRDVVGFEEMMRMPTAAFVAAGGYHHHLAFNVWRGQNVPAEPAGTVGLRHWTIVLPDDESVEALKKRAADAGIDTEEADGALVLRDPWGIELHVERA
jgi:catechol 2,3-dioxygenase